MLNAAGRQTVVSAFYGLEGAPTQKADGTVVLPRGMDMYGNDIVPSHLSYPHWKDENGNSVPGDVVISLCDPFVFDPDIWKQFPWAAWVPVDSAPLFAGNAHALQAARWVWSMSRFGHERLQEAGLAPIYVPHGVRTDVYKPVDRAAARKKIGQYLGTNLEDKYLVITVAANKGSPSRKNFVQMIEAFALYALGNKALGIEPHPDAMYYIHTEPRGIMQGEDIRGIAAAFGVSDRILLPQQYHILIGSHTPEYMNDVYNAGDVFMLLSSEGFGIPTVEAQAAGCPVMVADFTASPELCFGGWTVPGLKKYIPTSKVFWYDPVILEATKALVQATATRGNEELRAKARAGALDYDATTVFNKYMLPAIELMERDLAKDREAQDVQAIKAERDALKAKLDEMSKKLDAAQSPAAQTANRLFPVGNGGKALK